MVAQKINNISAEDKIFKSYQVKIHLKWQIKILGSLYQEYYMKKGNEGKYQKKAYDEK